MREATQRLIKGSFWLFISGVLTSGFSLAFWLLVSHFVSQEVVGYVGNVFSSVMWSSGLLTLGSEYALLRYGKTERKDEFFTSFLLLEATVGALGALIMYLWAGKGTFGINYRPYFAIGATILFLTCMGSVVRFSLISALRSDLLVLVSLLANLIRFGFASFFIFLRGGISGIQILLCTLFSSVFSVSLGLYFSLKNYSLSRKFFRGLKEMLGIGLSNFPVKVFFVVISSLSITILSFLTKDPSLVGQAYISLMIMLTVSSLQSSIAMNALPVSVGYSDTYSLSIRYSLSLTALVGSVVLSSPERILEIINSKMGGAWPLLSILMASSPLYALVSNLVSRLNYEGKRKDLLALGGILISSFFLSLVIFLRTAYQMALGLAVLTSTIGCLLYIFSKRERRDLVRQLILSEASLIVGGGIGLLFSMKFGTLLGIIPGALITFAMLSKLKMLTLGDIILIIKAVSGRSK